MTGDPADPSAGWDPGQPPPWLAQYGAPPVDPSIAGAPSAPQPMPSAMDAAPAPGAPAPMQPVPVPMPDGSVAPSPPQTAAPAPGEIQMPDEFVGQGPNTAAPAPTVGGPAPFVLPWLAQSQTAAPGPAGVDATSGGPAPTDAQDPHAALHRIATDPNASTSDRAQAWQQLTPAERTDTVNNADPKQLASLATAAMSPEDLATIQVRHAQQQIHEQSAAQLQLAQQQDQQARANFQTYQAATQKADTDTTQLSQDAQALSQEKIDPNEHGVGHFIASVLTAAIGGFASSGTGGRNLALEELDKGTERRIQAQKDAIANKWQGVNFKRNLIQEQLQRSGDIYKAQETYRLSQYDRATSELQTKMQDYDPQGTTALRIAGSLQQIQGARQTALAAFNQQQLKNEIDKRKSEDERAKQIEDARHNKATEGIDWAKVGIEKNKAAAEKKQDVTYSPQELASMFGGAAPPEPMTIAKYGAFNETQGKVNAARTGAVEGAQKLAAGQVRDVNGNPALDDKGQPIQVDPKAAEHINTIRAKGQQAIDSLSEARRLLASDPSTIDRHTFELTKENLERAGAAVAGTMGEKTSPRAIEAAMNLLGDDYDSYVKRYLNKGEGGVGAQKIDDEIDGLKRDLNTEAKVTTGVKTSANFFDTSRPTPTATTEQDKANTSLGTDFTKLQPDEVSGLPAADRAFVTATTGVSKDFLSDATYRQGLMNDHYSPEVNRALAAGIAPTQLQKLDSMQAAIRGADPKASSAALDALGAVAAKGANANIRAYAQSLIDEASGSAIGSLGTSEQLEPTVR